MALLSVFGLTVNVLAVVNFSKTFTQVLEQVKDARSSVATQDIVNITRSLKESTAKLTQTFLAK
ncbi:hypothetical protein LY78DRAFT_582480 [Colletotrichum sublineola]|nr:hypothetical protein LY78DRAFT_582480 [Colletotrichum sublineola]